MSACQSQAGWIYQFSLYCAVLKNIFLTPPWKVNSSSMGWEWQMPIEAFKGKYETKTGISRGVGRRDSSLNAFCERDYYFLEK